MKIKNIVLQVAAGAALVGLGVGIGHWSARVAPQSGETDGQQVVVSSVAPQGAEKSEEAKPAPELPVPLAVKEVNYTSEDTLIVYLNHLPDAQAIRHYVSVEPLRSGAIDLDVYNGFNPRAGCNAPVLRIQGDFALRTNSVLRIRRGLKAQGKALALAEDFTYTFRRKDLAPSVKFANKGRYLPPCGSREIALSAVNVTNVTGEIRRVEPRNIVQLLAREEGAYRSYYGGGGDSFDTIELSGAPTTFSRACRKVPNERVTVSIPVCVTDGGASNGVYLVSLDNDRWSNARLVCLSDLALSVRHSDADGLGVWVTSLTTGRPLANAWVEVYAANGVKIKEGRTDSNGWSRPDRRASGEPFAVVVYSEEADDMTFMAFADELEVDETHADEGTREDYLKPTEVKGFLWTERGIYRHGEKIFAHLILRDGTMKAPKPFPVELQLVNPSGTAVMSRTVLPDANGVLSCEDFTAEDQQPSGTWEILARVPGKNGRILARREVKIEEFALPQVRVTVTPVEGTTLTNFAFAVAGEYLFGGVAGGLRAEGAVVFEDLAFAPKGWKGYSFGNADRGLKPRFIRTPERYLDADGCVRFEQPIHGDLGLPKAAVRALVQGTVFEDGGRSANARASAVIHPYPYYIGTTLTGWRQLDEKTIRVACVKPDGTALGAARRLVVKLERIDPVYSYRQRLEWTTWDARRVRTTIFEDVTLETGADGTCTYELPLNQCGDYALTLTDPESGASFAREFYLSNWGDDTVRAPLANPTAVTIRPDKAFYRVGETPRLIVKSPFAGAALLSVLREKEVYTEVLTLTNATSEVVLRPVRTEDAPNLDVSLSVVQGVTAGDGRFAVRAHGETTIDVRPKAQEIDVGVSAEVTTDERGRARVAVAICAPGATEAVVTLVDEGINLLTGEKVPDPIGAFAARCTAEHPLYDLYSRLLPVLGETLKANGVKTGGGFGAELLSRVSPVASRRFKPLARWQTRVAIADGRGTTEFELPEFAGEVRVTALAYSPSATGAGSIHTKVTPKVILMPDAPRFVAPGDWFDARATVKDANGTSNLVWRLQAPAEPGTMPLTFRAEGFGEVHEETIELPVRPSVAWVETSGWERLAPGAASTATDETVTCADGSRYSERIYTSPVGAYAAALRWLGEYPHGCLEQTASRIFPLVAAGEGLGAIVSNGTDYVTAGVRRVESMIRERDFVMWPDCTYAPWTREVSVYAAHFLIAAERQGVKLNPAKRERVLRFVRQWTLGDDLEISAYAALVGTLAGACEKDRLYRLYDDRAKLSMLALSRLSLAFAEIGERARATELLASAFDPQSVKEAAFRLMALVRLDPEDARVLPLVAWLNARRDRARLSWGTTEENAHALLAIGTYFAAVPPVAGETYKAWRKLALPKVEDVVDEQEGLFIDRRYLTSDGTPADLTNLRCGELLFTELVITSAVARVVNDLVIEDLLPGAFEPVSGGDLAFRSSREGEWIMRTDARDDRMLVFSKRFKLEVGHEAKFVYPVRVVSAGDFVLPGPSVEGMYDPHLHARRAPGRLVVRP